MIGSQIAMKTSVPLAAGWMVEVDCWGRVSCSVGDPRFLAWWGWGWLAQAGLQQKGPFGKRGYEGGFGGCWIARPGVWAEAGLGQVKGSCTPPCAGSWGHCWTLLECRERPGSG